MNIIEAIKSGMPFRRAVLSGHGWYVVHDLNALTLKLRDHEGYFNLTIASIIADDWELYEPTVTITRTQFMDAYGRTMKKMGNRFDAITVDVLLGILPEELGLGK